MESEKEVNVGLAAKPDQTNASVQAALNYIIDTGEKPVTASNAPGDRASLPIPESMKSAP